MKIDELASGTAAQAETARLFDEYRVHYGWPSAPERTHEWLLTQLVSGRLIAWTASVDSLPDAFVTVAPTPASLALGVAWQVRDLYVSPHARRRGLARALMAHVLVRANAAAVTRVSLQTEVDNAPALQLYRQLGFKTVDGLCLLNLTMGGAQSQSEASKKA